MGWMVGLGLICFTHSFGQNSYTSAEYAVAGDSVFLTEVQPGTVDFSLAGANITWDYSQLVGSGQRLVQFRAPSQTGFTPAQWPYIQNASNVNLSSTDESVVSIGALQYSEPNDYFLLTTSALSQKAVSSKLTLNSTTFSIKTVYSAPDVVYQFPLTYGNTPDSCVAIYTSSIPNVYYKETHLKRKNTIDAWGTLITPYGSFTDCIRVYSEIMRIDTMSVDTIAFATDTSFSRELKWLHPSFGYPVLEVKQSLVNGVYITNSIEYADEQQYFQPTAFFAYLPLLPQVGDTMLFQNLSTDAQSYFWKFNDPFAAVDTSVVTNPQHIFSVSGTYPVQLIAWNGTLSDTLIIPVVISDTVAPVASFYWLENPAFVGDSIHFQNTSQFMVLSDWDFGDVSSGGFNTSVANNPGHVFSQVGTYTVRLIATNAIGADTSIQLLTIQDTVSPQAAFTWLPDTIYVNDTVYFQNLSQFSTDFLWDFGDPIAGINNVSLLSDPSHNYATSGIYAVTLIASNTFFSDTITDSVIVLPMITTALNEWNMQVKMVVYPNPAAHRVYFEAGDSDETRNVCVYDIVGECCLNDTTMDHFIDVSALKPGCYTLVVYDEGHQFRSGFVKQ